MERVSVGWSCVLRPYDLVAKTLERDEEFCAVPWGTFGSTPFAKAEDLKITQKNELPMATYYRVMEPRATQQGRRSRPQRAEARADRRVS
jgi:hypothetical protein